jgi:hypothetical protein
MKKPNLSTIAAELERRDVYIWQDTTIKCTMSGFFSVTKGGQTRLFSRLRDAWLAMSLTLCFIVPCGLSYAQELPKNKVIDCILGEAEGSGYRGMLAISHAIRNRGNLKGVYGCNSPRVKQHKYSSKTFVDAVRAWEDSRLGYDITEGATGWGNDKDLTIFARSTWWKNCEITVSIGGNNFYSCNK